MGQADLLTKYGSFQKLGVPYFGVLIIRILLFRVLYQGPLFLETLISYSGRVNNHGRPLLYGEFDALSLANRLISEFKACIRILEKLCERAFNVSLCWPLANGCTVAWTSLW